MVDFRKLRNGIKNGFRSGVQAATNTIQESSEMITVSSRLFNQKRFQDLTVLADAIASTRELENILAQNKSIISIIDCILEDLPDNSSNSKCTIKCTSFEQIEFLLNAQSILGTIEFIDTNGEVVELEKNKDTILICEGVLLFKTFLVNRKSSIMELISVPLDRIYYTNSPLVNITASKTEAILKALPLTQEKILSEFKKIMSISKLSVEIEGHIQKVEGLQSNELPKGYFSFEAFDMMDDNQIEYILESFTIIYDKDSNKFSIPYESIYSSRRQTSSAYEEISSHVCEHLEKLILKMH